MRIYTAGHSNLKIEKFISNIQAHKIEMLADVRSIPSSRFSPQFNKNNIERVLGQNKIEYVFMGKSLGGFPRQKEFFDDEGCVLYWKMAQSQIFIEGVEELIHNASRHNVAIMCGEENPERCHRRLLVASCLAAKGFEIFHIRKDGASIKEADAAGLIALTQSTDNWKSERPAQKRN